MTPQTKKKALESANLSQCDAEAAANIAERQAIIKQLLLMLANNQGENAPVALAYIAVLPNGQTETQMVNVEPEHVPILLEAGNVARNKMLDFFNKIDKTSAQIIPIK